MLSEPLLQNKLLKSVFSDYNFTFSGEKENVVEKKKNLKRAATSDYVTDPLQLHLHIYLPDI